MTLLTQFENFNQVNADATGKTKVVMTKIDLSLDFVTDNYNFV